MVRDHEPATDAEHGEGEPAGGADAGVAPVKAARRGDDADDRGPRDREARAAAVGADGLGGGGGRGECAEGECEGGGVLEVVVGEHDALPPVVGGRSVRPDRRQPSARAAKERLGAVTDRSRRRLNSLLVGVKRW